MPTRWKQMIFLFERVFSKTTRPIAGQPPTATPQNIFHIVGVVLLFHIIFSFFYPRCGASERAGNFYDLFSILPLFNLIKNR